MSGRTKRWFCDNCGQPIERAEDGWVEWIDPPGSEAGRGRDLRIVHYFTKSPLPDGCQFDSDAEYAKDGGMIADAALREYQGPDGLMRLLEMVADQVLPSTAILEVIKRIHIPGYELARRHVDRALAEGVIELNVRPGYWWQDDIQRDLDFADEGSED